MPYRLTNAATQDLESILERSLVEFGTEQTAAYVDSLTRCIDLLGENPSLGTAADDIRPGYRRFPHESHVVFYLPRQADILIVRILHHRMDVLRHLRP